MKLFLFLLLALGLAPFYDNLNQYQHQKSYICEKVIDGDTVKLRRNGRLITVRLAYIDTPELKQKSLDGVAVGKMITSYLDRLLTGKVVSVRLLKRDIYGRWLGELYFKEHFINLLLVEKGLSVLYPRAIFRSRVQKRKFMQAYFVALSNKVGVWKTSGLMNPYHYRKMSKK